MDFEEILGRKLGPLPVGGWVLVVAGAAVAAYTFTRNRDTTVTTTEVQQVPVPVGAIAAVDQAPLVMSPIFNVNTQAFDALANVVTQQVEATKQNTNAVVGSTGAITGNTAAVAAQTKTILSTPAPVTVSPAASSGPAYPGRWTQQGNRGSTVSMIQRQLNARGASPRLAEDGVFGSETRKAVRAFQVRNGLLVDGIVGPQTWGALF